MDFPQHTCMSTVERPRDEGRGGGGWGGRGKGTGQVSRGTGVPCKRLPGGRGSIHGRKGNTVSLGQSDRGAGGKADLQHVAI